MGQKVKIACTIFVCEPITKVMVPMERWDFKYLLQLWKKIVFYPRPPQNERKPNFSGIFLVFSNKCTIFFANATGYFSMSFWNSNYCLQEYLWKKIYFSLETPKTEKLTFCPWCTTVNAKGVSTFQLRSSTKYQGDHKNHMYIAKVKFVQVYYLVMVYLVQLCTFLDK